ncbi:type III secretion system chaperone [Pseudomonas cannabina]|nr:type III secretion system chaperone [Pseudomonas cannabina]KAA8696187.1 type III secretion system chaperone [Pseudomonas cannabina]KPW79277.1 Type III secretion system-associated chaperone, CesT family [Pseudomonas cannabina]SDR47301.1 Tir chaperone protein (CesT) family protein [Pseudomonas cannabina]
MMIQNLLNALAIRLESGPLSLDANHLCSLKVNELDMTLERLEQQNTLFVYLSVGTLSTPASSTLLSNILAANLFHYGSSDGAAFGLDEKNNEVLLFQRFDPSRIDEDDFVSACVQMIEVANLWRPKLLHSHSAPLASSSRLTKTDLMLTMAGTIR